MSATSASSQAILEASKRVLDRDGWQQLTAERVAVEAGVSRVTLHRRGLTKQVILGLLAEAAVEDYQRAMWPALTASSPASDRLREGLRIICRLAEENLSLLLALDAQANAAIFHDGDGPEVLTRTVFTAPIERLLRDGIAEGALRQPTNLSETATVIFNLVGWTYIHLRTGHAWKPARAQKATLDLVLHGLLT